MIEQRQAAAPKPDELQQMRAVMILEWIADDETKNLLQRWAGGPFGALLTQEAAAAQRRLRQ